jgi:RNA polymerase sigma-70 factor (ECF subfamily)
MSEDFGQIYDQYVARIYRFIFLKVSSQEIAEDLCSEVFVQTFKESQETTIANMQAFLYQVARHTIADYYRQENKMQVVRLDANDEIGLFEDYLLEEVIVRSEMEEVRKALAILHDEYQNLIIWRYLDELSIPEIAQIEGKSEGSVRVGLHRAMEALRGKLVGHEDISNVPM